MRHRDCRAVQLRLESFLGSYTHSQGAQGLAQTLSCTSSELGHRKCRCTWLRGGKTLFWFWTSPQCFSTDALIPVVLFHWLVCLIGSKLSMLLKDQMNGVRDHTLGALRGSAITSHPSFRMEIKGRAKRRCLLGI